MGGLQGQATGVEPVVPGLWRWRARDARTGESGDAYAVVDEGWVALVDPLPIDEAALAPLGRMHAIVLTSARLQRDAWRLRERLRVPVWAPEGGLGLEREPDHLYAGGDLLPCGLAAFHAPGPTLDTHVLWRARPVAAVLLSGLLTRENDGPPAFPEGDLDDPARARASLRRLLDDLPFSAACFARGAPLVDGARERLLHALDEGRGEPAGKRPDAPAGL